MKVIFAVSIRPVLCAAALSALLLGGGVQAGGAGAPLPRAGAAASTTQQQAGRALLVRAIEANGGEALRGLRTMTQGVELVFMDAQGQPAITLNAAASVDYANRWARQTTKQGQTLISEQWLTAEGAFAFAPQSGTVPLPRQEAQSLRDSFYYGAPGLIAAEQGRGSFRNLGQQTWLKVNGKDLTGTVLEAVTNNTKATFLLDSRGLVVAERYPIAPLGEVISVYSDFEEVGGIPFSDKAQAFLPNGTLIFTADFSEVQMNVALPASTFAVPQ
ncbi:hypothetical protein [Deinococcus puniceus]|uniref:Lipoprotein n=1 Tax=Deinococcus puniceus TaxID=1182568 RepID=A0A172T774_9DEIO|nr:hypothetical protein [Deinococcus puniceus]ANE42841.1 hypothetical protein SU48_02655 [Deinococcus puniceus]